MSIIRTILSIGAGILAAAASYVLMSSNDKKNESVNTSSECNRPEEGNCCSKPSVSKSDKVIRKLDKIQIGLVNFARFTSEVIRSIILFVRAMKCYEYDNSYQEVGYR